MKKNIFLVITLMFLIISLCIPMVKTEAAGGATSAGAGVVGAGAAAGAAGAGGVAETSGNANFDINAFDKPPATQSVSTVNNLTDNVLGSAISIARIAGMGIAIVMLTVIGIKYMLASPGDRADIKKNAVPFVIGAIVLFGASGIITILIEFSKNIS